MTREGSVPRGISGPPEHSPRPLVVMEVMRGVCSDPAGRLPRSLPPGRRPSPLEGLGRALSRQRAIGTIRSHIPTRFSVPSPRCSSPLPSLEDPEKGPVERPLHRETSSWAAGPAIRECAARRRIARVCPRNVLGRWRPPRRLPPPDPRSTPRGRMPPAPEARPKPFCRHPRTSRRD